MTRPNRASSWIVGVVAAFVAGVAIARAIRPELLTDSEVSWAIPRLILGLLVAVGAASAGVLAAALFRLWAGTESASAPLAALPLSRVVLVLLFAVGIAGGALFRFFQLDRLPGALWEDDTSLIAPSLELTATPRDFADSVRPVMYGISGPYGSVGVLYMELFRVLLKAAGTTVFGIRLVSAASGVLSLLTAAWLARALLPRGGATVAAIVLAGLRWHLILSRWGWNMILLAPLVDLACLAALRARRRRDAVAAGAAGILIGIGTHVYLAAWIAAAAIFALLLWPRPAGQPRPRLLSAAVFAVAVGACAAPLFLLREGRVFPYLRRVGHHNVLGEMRLWKSWAPPFYAASDAAMSPWFLDDPTPRNDLPGRTRLGVVLGAAVAIAMARALLLWREDLSAMLLTQAGAGFAAAVAGGQYGLPNGSRFGYLADISAVAAAAGILWIVGRFPARARRAASLAAAGLLGALALLGARDAGSWARAKPTFTSFGGQDTLIGRAASRWSRLGAVRVSKGLGHPPEEVSEGTIRAIQRFRLDPDEPLAAAAFSATLPRARRFRVVSPAVAPEAGERPVERIMDDWGRCWAVVLGRAGPA